MLVASMAAGVLGGCGNGDAAGTSSVSGGTESAGSGTSGDVVRTDVLQCGRTGGSMDRSGGTGTDGGNRCEVKDRLSGVSR